MESTFKPTQVTMEDVDERFKSSKKHIIWHFKLDNEKHTAELECSYLTNKRRVTFDGTLMFTGYKPIGGVFQYRFFHMKHVVTIDNPGADADLLVDSLSFNDLYWQKILEIMYGKDSASRQPHKDQVPEYPTETFKKAGEEPNIQPRKAHEIDLIGQKPKNEFKNG
ncbi:unnamed protein product [Blepharisma stoltei]|uniref:Uncharacterized protein n=1 Tax=Blepharisma stoltei TaxID=1481888 RepID=A0AAU9JSC8_9CILI|nr:unnamed protein product [Blepharisma stoltei]